MSVVVAVPVEEELGSALVVAVCIVTNEGIISLGSVGVGDGGPVGVEDGGSVGVEDGGSVGVGDGSVGVGDGGSVGVGDGGSVGAAEGEGDTSKVEEGTVGVDIDCTSVVGAKAVLDVGR